MRITTPSLLLLTLVLTACGGGGSGSPSSNNPPSQEGGQQPVVTAPASEIIEYYGDSTIKGWQTGSQQEVIVAKPAPQAFYEALPTSPTTYTVRNKGVSGTTACDLRDGSAAQPDNWSTQMASSDANVVIINHGINDLTKNGNVETYRTCLRDLVTTAKARGKRVVLETPNPITAEPGLDSFVQAMKTVADQNGVRVIDQYGYLLSQYSDASQITPDGLHPTDQVYIQKGRYAASVYVTLPRQ